MEDVAFGLLSRVSPLPSRSYSRRDLCSQVSSSTNVCRASFYRRKGLDLRTDFTCFYLTGSLYGSFSRTSLRTAFDTIDEAISRGSSRKGIVTMGEGSSSLPVRNDTCALQQRHHKPQTSFHSRGEDLGVCKMFSGSQCLLIGANHASPNKFSSSSFVCRMRYSQGSEWEREEARWLQEEKRWVREEERWLREESRWAAERKDLLEQAVLYREQIKSLKLEISQLESQVNEEKSKDGSLFELTTSLTSLLQSLSTTTPLGSEVQGSVFQNQISSSSSSSTDIKSVLGSIPSEVPIKTIEMLTTVHQPPTLESKVAVSPPSPSYDKSSRTLKRGAEGDDVKALQEALAKLGFFSGDDDMEYSTFSSGTERAVRSWQATLGALENGVVTGELLEKLLSEETATPSEKGPRSSSSQGNAAPSTKAATTPGVKPPNAKVKMSDVKSKTSASPGPERVAAKAASASFSKSSNSVFETSRPRVYLLGENRWEEPDRLISKNGPTAASSVATTAGVKCFSCKGQGNMMCTECEGTGELNVEEQFLEWADEDAKCPYCEGKGMLDCDVCDGKGVQASA